MASVIAFSRPGKIQIVTGTLTAAQINHMNRADTPIQILPAPGANLTYFVHSFFIASSRSIDYTVAGPVNFWLALGSQDNYSDAITVTPQVDFLTQPATGGGAGQLLKQEPASDFFDFTVLVNNPLYLTCSDAISSGNGTCKYYLYYSVVGV